MSIGQRDTTKEKEELDRISKSVGIKSKLNLQERRLMMPN
jgi:hypothetical protein